MTVRADRIHIAFFGTRNSGKSSLLNAVAAQDIAVVSDTKGTTTDPVYKSMEILPLGAVVLIDTPGFDDEGELGEKRIQKTKEVLRKTDIALLIIDSTNPEINSNKQFAKILEEAKIPFIVVLNKEDIISETEKQKLFEKFNSFKELVFVSSKDKQNIDTLKEIIANFFPQERKSNNILNDICNKNDFVLLVTPIDESAPKGRLILPQVQTIRNALDAHAVCVVCQVAELSETLANLAKPPKIVITDSQAFSEVQKIVPKTVQLTSFSILLSNQKGFLTPSLEAMKHIKDLKDNDIILIAEGCTHHRQCGDIGTVKLPKMMKELTGKNLQFQFCSGNDFPIDLRKFAFVLHCGGCMINQKEIEYRIKSAENQNVPFANYGTFIAFYTGILERTTNFLK